MGDDLKSPALFSLCACLTAADYIWNTDFLCFAGTCYDRYAARFPRGQCLLAPLKAGLLSHRTAPAGCLFVLPFTIHTA
jgi:hypothetical protein